MNEMQDKLEKQRSRRIFAINIVTVTFLSIAILVAIGIYRGSILSNPKNPRTAAIAIESAVNNFHTEYGTMPDVKNHLTTDSADGIKLLTILQGRENPSTPMQNSRSVNFLSIKEASSLSDFEMEEIHVYLWTR